MIQGMINRGDTESLIKLKDVFKELCVDGEGMAKLIVDLRASYEPARKRKVYKKNYGHMLWLPKRYVRFIYKYFKRMQ